LYDVKRRREKGSLHSHEGTITAFDFYRTSHVVSAGADGILSLYRTRDWECLTQFPSHHHTGPSSSSSSSSSAAAAAAAKKQRKSDTQPVKSSKKDAVSTSVFNMPESGLEHAIPVVSVAIHPSGKLMLSLALDRTLRLWDLTRAKAAFTTRLALPGHPSTSTGTVIEQMRKE
jgi:WD40 repeat protein